MNYIVVKQHVNWSLFHPFVFQTMVETYNRSEQMLGSAGEIDQRLNHSCSNQCSLEALAAGDFTGYSFLKCRLLLLLKM